VVKRPVSLVWQPKLNTRLVAWFSALTARAALSAAEAEQGPGTPVPHMPIHIWSSYSSAYQLLPSV
jgi:hypothetical protein